MPGDDSALPRLVSDSARSPIWRDPRGSGCDRQLSHHSECGLVAVACLDGAPEQIATRCQVIYGEGHGLLGSDVRRRGAPGTFSRKKTAVPALAEMVSGWKRGPASTAVIAIGMAPPGAVDAFTVVDVSDGREVGREVGLEVAAQGTNTPEGEADVVGVVEVVAPAAPHPPIAMVKATSRALRHRLRAGKRLSEEETDGAQRRAHRTGWIPSRWMDYTADRRHGNVLERTSSNCR